jgi:hypothetical protein
MPPIELHWFNWGKERDLIAFLDMLTQECFDSTLER